MIAKLALQRGHTVCGQCSSTSWNWQAVQIADICIEFSEPNSVVKNICKLAELKKNVVVGTTGWYEDLDEVEKQVLEHQIGLLYAPNFSLGIHLYMEILNRISSLFNFFPEYDVAGVEWHHNQKKDTPSGTAQMISQLIQQQVPRINSLDFSSVRCGHIPGKHEILFDSPSDKITICHEARNREGFALGAIQAGEWLQNRKGLFTFQDYIKDLIKGKL